MRGVAEEKVNFERRRRGEIFYTEGVPGKKKINLGNFLCPPPQMIYTQNPGFSAYTHHWVLNTWDELIMSISQVGKPLHVFMSLNRI